MDCTLLLSIEQAEETMIVRRGFIVGVPSLVMAAPVFAQGTRPVVVQLGFLG